MLQCTLDAVVDSDHQHNRVNFADGFGFWCRFVLRRNEDEHLNNPEGRRHIVRRSSQNVVGTSATSSYSETSVIHAMVPNPIDELIDKCIVLEVARHRQHMRDEITHWAIEETDRRYDQGDPRITVSTQGWSS